MSNNTNPFVGKNIVITGKLNNYTRNDIHKHLMELGAHPMPNVTRNTDYIIVGSKAGSKLDKARALGVTILSEYDFEMMRDGDIDED